MRAILYVYDIEDLNLLQEKLSNSRFISIAYLIHISNTVEDLTEMDPVDINNSVIDITNIIKDGNYFRIFTERYLLILSDNFENVNFCIQSSYLNSFKEMFPYFFEEENINHDFHNTDDDHELSNKVFEIHTPLTLYAYKNLVTIKKLYKDGCSISLGNLIEESEGIVFKYNLKNIGRTIVEKEIEYIDISSVIKTLKLRTDLTFQFEILLHKISSIKDVKYSVESSLVSDAIELLPLIFAEEFYIDDCGDENEVDNEQSNIIDIGKINLIADQIIERLKGHAVFKNDFKHNLLKFSFLNNMDERKILSILLCGDSGIGKTEFAKILSSIVFPDEPLIKINFGNYSTEGVLNSLIGSPLGYIGSEEGGELINKINSSKSKVILIDEFERATPSVFNFFYELLEDGKFTDRHGFEHNLNGYVIVFTSNMTQKQYEKHVPNSLKSRFDMIYYFIDIPEEDKTTYIQNTASSLIEKLEEEFDVLVEFESIKLQLNELVKYKNLRDIKRRIEDIVFSEFFEQYKGN
jgi:energy-coupling factor transporter ATP-binding protein EcfA2